jgi:hypothetical protein
MELGGFSRSLSPVIVGIREIKLATIANPPRRASHQHQGECARSETSYLCIFINRSNDSRSRRSCSTAGMFADDAPVIHSKIQHHHGVQHVEGSP